MKRAIPVVVLSIAGLIPVWRYEPSIGGTTSTTAESSTTDSSTAGSSTAGSAASPSASSTAGSGTSAGTVVKGTTVNTDKGPVQVQVTFSADKISAVSMLQQPNHPQTTAAVPVLISETLKAQSADIDTVSGATITSDAYKESLQAAIDAKG
ncbi:FMN-binding protein [Streptomyces sp. NPDC058464]|uniref:FMN-binding protein n=1 Tax=Streptomyces sp. NPDC058464 TaxID=3346511 RepID=UPI00364A92BA